MSWFMIFISQKILGHINLHIWSRGLFSNSVFIIKSDVKEETSQQTLGKHADTQYSSFISGFMMKYQKRHFWKEKIHLSYNSNLLAIISERLRIELKHLITSLARTNESKSILACFVSENIFFFYADQGLSPWEGYHNGLDIPTSIKVKAVQNSTVFKVVFCHNINYDLVVFSCFTKVTYETLRFIRIALWGKGLVTKSVDLSSTP